MTMVNRVSSVVRWTLRLAGLALFFLFTAAPLPGNTPGCEAASLGDLSAAVACRPYDPTGACEINPTSSDSAVQVLCGLRCSRDCTRLVACGRYAPGTGLSQCNNDCISGVRDCVHQTLESLCPASLYPDAEITQTEESACLSDSLNRDCWCTDGQNCFDTGMPVPVSCTASAMCDLR